jgi:uncharacterized protein YlxW (UPF0749 family)
MQRRMAQLSLFAVAVLSGMLLVGQLRSQARPIELSSLPAAELSTLIEALSTRNAELRTGLADLREQVRDYQLAEAQGQSALDVTRADLERLLSFSGVDPVRGQGIEVTVDGDLDAIAVNDLINELRNAGAEAIALDNVRLTAGSVAVRGAGSLEIDGVAFGRDFAIRAIGSPEGLQAALERPGGIISQLELFVAATITIEQLPDLRLPATSRDLAPQVGQPAG